LKELLRRNEDLPEQDKLPLENFILDPDQFEQKLQHAQEEIEAECNALDSEAEEHQRAVQMVLKTFWNDMERPSRTITVA
jgi:hypothetical protein